MFQNPISNSIQAIALCGLVVSRIAAANGRCEPQWDATFAPSKLDGHVRSMIIHDDGSGPSLFVGGAFFVTQDPPSYSMARWDGAQWHGLGEGLFGTVRALAVFDSGDGAALIAGGSFLHARSQEFYSIAQWDGSQWSDLGSGLSNPNAGEISVHSMAVFNDGTGDALYVSGRFAIGDGTVAQQIAKWDGQHWEPIAQLSHLDWISPIIVFDDGTGPALYAAGTFSSIGGVAAANIAKWNGQAWSPLAEGASFVGAVTNLAKKKSCLSGPVLYAQGNSGLSDNWVSAWNGTTWSKPAEIGQGIVHEIYAPNGDNEVLFLGCQFLQGDGGSIHGIAAWDGTTLHPVDGGMGQGGTYESGAYCFLQAGPESLYVGGAFNGVNDINATDLASLTVCTDGSAIADANSDGCINAADLQIVIAAWGTCPSQPCQGDLNGSSAVDVDDLLLIINHWTG